MGSPATGWPIVADPLSGLRCGPHDRSQMLARGDQLARPGPWIDAHPPALVVRTGAMPTSKPVTELLARTRPELWVLDGDSGWREAAFLPARYLHADAARTALAIAERLVHAHQGRIEARRAPGGGSDFRVTLPLKAETPARQEAEVAPTGLPL